MKKGENVYVKGEVKWGDNYYNVDTNGIIEEWKNGAYALVTLEEVDNDYGVCVHVRKKYINKDNFNNN